MYIFPLLKEVKDQGKEYRGYKSDDPPLKPPKEVCHAKHGIRNVQVIPILTLFTPVFNQTGHVHHQDVCFHNKFTLNRSTPGTQ